MPEPARRYAYINLPHAHTVLGRIVRWLEYQQSPCTYHETRLPDILTAIDRLLRPYPEDPPVPLALQVADQVAQWARYLVDECERVGYQGDRLGQCVRNLFECLGLGPEGAELSLRCGERPDSPLRP
ncbi:MAG: hypothetical protein ACE5MH_00900 [Terriglobia bacterium]